MIQEIYPWISVEFHVSNEVDYPTHMALAQSVGDPIDVVSTFCLNYQTEMSSGAYMDITDYLGDYEGLTSALPDFAYDWGIKDGRTYGFPNWQQCNYANDSFAVEKETADKYGLDVDAMNTLIQSEEFLNPEVYTLIGDFLAAAKAAGDESVIFTPGGRVLGPVTRGYEQITGPFYYALSDSGCTVVNIWETQQVKDYLAALAEYKEAGYVPVDYFENSAAYSGKTAFESGYSPFQFSDNAYVPNFPSLRLKNWGADMYFMQTNKSEDEYIIGYNYAAGLTCVGATCEYPEDALRFIELLYTNEEIQNMIVYGLEGEHYTKNGDGTITTLEYDGGQASAKNSYGLYKFTVGNSGLTWINQSFDEAMKEWAFETMPNNATPSPLIGFGVDSSKISGKLSQINSIVTEYQKQLFQGGAVDLNATYAEFMEKLDKAKIDDIMKILQAQIDAFLANK